MASKPLNFDAVLSDESVMKKCADSFLQGVGSNPSGIVSVERLGIVQVTLRWAISKLRELKSRDGDCSSTAISTLKPLIRLLEMAQCDIWDMCKFLQASEIV